jgi:hypothetical protein
MPGVPTARDDKRLLVVTGFFLVVAAVLVAGVLLLATNRDAVSEKPKPIFIGLRNEITKNIKEDGPRYVANPFGHAGFWLDLEEGRLTALVLAKPGTSDCNVKWKEQRGTYIDCNGDPIDARDLDRYPVFSGVRDGSPKGSVFVDIRKIDPAPGGGDATG